MNQVIDGIERDIETLPHTILADDPFIGHRDATCIYYLNFKRLRD